MYRFLEAVVLNIFQGESRKVEDNVRLGQIDLPVPPKRAGAVSIDVRFSYDINGLFEVDVQVPESGETKQLVIVDEDTDMNSGDMKRRRDELAALKIHPREADENRAALARGTRCYEQFLGDRREYVGQLLGQFEAILDRQNPAEIERARTEFMESPRRHRWRSLLVTRAEDIWDVLGTERPNDMLMIRRAYARRLKVTNPEDDAAGFERLRAAFDRAIALAGQATQARTFGQSATLRPEFPPERAPLAAAAPVPAPVPMPVPSPTSATPETSLLRLQNKFQALDAALTNPAGRDAGRLLAMCISCLELAAIENVQLQFERTVANWLLVRRPASDMLFTEAASRLGWPRREHSLDLPPDIAAVLQHLRDLQFWSEVQDSTGMRAHARMALQRKPRPALYRMQMVIFKLNKHVRILLGEISNEHGGLAAKLDADAVSWWRAYFSKPRFAWRGLAPLGVLIPVMGFFGILGGLIDHAVVRDGVTGVAIAVALSAAILLFKLYALDWPKHWCLQKYAGRLPVGLRLGWFPASLGALALSAVLPESTWSLAAAAIAGICCVVWVFVVTNELSLDEQILRRNVGHWVLLNVPLLIVWACVRADGSQGPTLPMLPSALALLVAEYRYGISAPARKWLPLAIAGAAILALLLAMTLPARVPWVGVNVLILTEVVIVARPPALREAA